MASVLDTVDEEIKEKSNSFTKKIESDMHFQSECFSDAASLDWLKEVEYACPYLDNIVRAPKMTLVSEEEVVKIEKAKKISVASVKDLTRHTQFIAKQDKKTGDVEPSKLLEVRSEETFNTYENRFIYTLLIRLSSYVLMKEEEMEDAETNNSKTLEYAATTSTNLERINIELKISAEEKPKDDSNGIEDTTNVKYRIKRVKEYMTSWHRSNFFKSLEKAHAILVKPPITKTNVILKNPNFQVAMKLWNFLQIYDNNGDDNQNGGLNSGGDNVLKGILDHSFLLDYFVLDSISKSRREEKEKLSKYSMIMINEEIQKIISLLYNSGIKIKDEDILAMVADAIKEEKSKRIVASSDVKKKFKSAMDEYLERTQDYL